MFRTALFGWSVRLWAEKKKQLSVQIFAFLTFRATLKKIRIRRIWAFLNCLILQKHRLSKLTSGDPFHFISSRKPARFNMSNGEIQQKFQWINFILLSVWGLCSISDVDTLYLPLFPANGCQLFKIFHQNKKKCSAHSQQPQLKIIQLFWQ